MSPCAVIHATLHAGPIAQLLAPWSALHALSSSGTPFMSARWAQHWWPHFARGADPFVFVMRDGDEVVGIAPLVRRRRAGFRILEPVGMDPGDYWDVIAAPAHRDAVADAFAAALKEHADEWDAWILRCTPEDSPVEAALDKAGFNALVRPRIQAPAIDLPETFDAYLRALPASHRQNLRKHLRRLDGGQVTLHVVTGDELPEAIERWQQLRREQWEAAGKSINPVHLTPEFADFMRDVTISLVPEGLAEVWQFSAEGRIGGVYINFFDNETYHWYLGGFDPAFARYGLGKIAIGHGIRTSIAAGRRRYDFGRGAEPYKYWYGSTDRMLAARVVGTERPRSRAALLAARTLLKVRPA